MRYNLVVKILKDLHQLLTGTMPKCFTGCYRTTDVTASITAETFTKLQRFLHRRDNISSRAELVVHVQVLGADVCDTFSC